MSDGTSAYVVLEGQDGCGKSVQARRLIERLRQAGRRVTHVREPGSTPVGEALRRLLLDRATGALQPVSEALLFFAARAELLQREIRPALAAGATVVAERSFLSTLVYQGTALSDGVPRALLQQLVAAVHAATLPDLVFVLDAPPEVCAGRRGGVADRFEMRDVTFHRAVRRGFLDLADEFAFVEVIDATRTADVIHEDLYQRVRVLLEVTS